MCVGAMDGGCQIDIASVVPAHIVFYILHQRLSVSLMAIILVNHQILKGIIKTGFGCQIKTLLRVMVPASLSASSKMPTR